MQVLTSKFSNLVPRHELISNLDSSFTLGWLFILSTSSIIFIIFASKRSNLSLLFIIAFLLRVSVSLASCYLPKLGIFDIDPFDEWCLQYLNEDTEVFFSQFPIRGSLLYPWILALIYKITFFYDFFGFDPLFNASINALLSALSIIVVYKLTLYIHDIKSALIAALLTAIWPTQILYSSISLREIQQFLPSLLGIYYYCLFIEKHKYTYAFFGITFMGIASLFHFGYLVIVILAVLHFGHHKINTLLKKYRLSIYTQKLTLSIISLLFIFILLSIITPLKIQQKYLEHEAYQSSLLSRQPSTLMLYHENPTQLLIEFLFGPFYWEINNNKLLIPYIESLIYTGLLIFIFIFRKKILNRKESVFILLAFLLLNICFSLGVNNHGTSIRHKAKFIPLLFIIIPWAKIKLSTKKKHSTDLEV